MKKPNIVRAILCQAKAQNIAVNAKVKYGYTAFIQACKYGWTDIVSMMLENAKEAKNKIDVNAKDDLKEKTGFMWACACKHLEVIDLLMTKAESFNIDLQCKDKDGKSGFDYFPQHFQK